MVIFCPVLSHALPLFHEMCKRFAQFITKCMYGSSALIQSVVMHSIHEMGFTSVITRNISTVSVGLLVISSEAKYQCMMTTV